MSSVAQNCFAIFSLRGAGLHKPPLDAVDGQAWQPEAEDATPVH
jgi:hypothetical protein